MPSLPFDPIDEAARQWGLRWDGVPAMHAVTSLMRAHQIVLNDLDALLKPLGLTFARYEALVLLHFSKAGALPMGKMGERLQVHPTSITSIIQRLEAAGYVVRTPHPTDGRAASRRSPLRAASSPSGPRRCWSTPTWGWGRSTPASCGRCRRCSARSERPATGSDGR